MYVAMSIYVLANTLKGTAHSTAPSHPCPGRKQCLITSPCPTLCTDRDAMEGLSVLRRVLARYPIQELYVI